MGPRVFKFFSALLACGLFVSAASAPHVPVIRVQLGNTWKVMQLTVEGEWEQKAGPGTTCNLYRGNVVLPTTPSTNNASQLIEEDYSSLSLSPNSKLLLEEQGAEDTVWELTQGAVEFQETGLSAVRKEAMPPRRKRAIKARGIVTSGRAGGIGNQVPNLVKTSRDVDRYRIEMYPTYVKFTCVEGQMCVDKVWYPEGAVVTIPPQP